VGRHRAAQLAAGAHQGWSANLFTTSSDMFPRSAVGSVVGIGGMAGSVGGAIFAFFAGHILQLTHSYTSPLQHRGERISPGAGHFVPACSRTEESGVHRMSLYCATGGIEADLFPQLKELLTESVAKLGQRNRVLAVPPDQSRLHSRAGELTRYAWEYYGDRMQAVLPALGTHTAMQPEQIARMFGAMPQQLFRVHNWRTEVETLGEVPAEFVYEQSEGKLNYAWPAQVNRLIAHGGFDLILSIGQVVPHEVIGMANYNKNILVGTGGRDGINRSHYLGAVYGMR
jgi:hypothetical protein